MIIDCLADTLVDISEDLRYEQCKENFNKDDYADVCCTSVMRIDNVISELRKVQEELRKNYN